MKDQNIRTIHKDAFPSGRFKHPAKWFTGKLVKAKFLSMEGRGELMWVRITSAARGEIIGFLDNDPSFATYMRYGDEVRLRPKDVLDVCKD